MVVSRMDWASMMHRHVCVWERVTYRCFQCLLLCDPHFCRWHASCICRSMSAQHCNCRFNQCVSDAPSIVNLNVGNIDQQIQCWQVILNSELSPQFVDQCRHNLAFVDSISVSLMQFAFINLNVGKTSIKKYVMWHHRHWWRLTCESAIAPRTTRTYTKHTPVIKTA